MDHIDQVQQEQTSLSTTTETAQVKSQHKNESRALKTDNIVENMSEKYLLGKVKQPKHPEAYANDAPSKLGVLDNKQVTTITTRSNSSNALKHAFLIHPAGKGSLVNVEDSKLSFGNDDSQVLPSNNVSNSRENIGSKSIKSVLFLPARTQVERTRNFHPGSKTKNKKRLQQASSLGIDSGNLAITQSPLESEFLLPAVTQPVVGSNIFDSAQNEPSTPSDLGNSLWHEVSRELGQLVPDQSQTKQEEKNASIQIDKLSSEEEKAKNVLYIWGRKTVFLLLNVSFLLVFLFSTFLAMKVMEKIQNGWKTTASTNIDLALDTDVEKSLIKLDEFRKYKEVEL